ncbi:MAG: chromosome segregation protein SMC [Planctomycetaceae bacterium]|jgi:chromosome segregation protein|nr:chromosome segregation protein SMC [Planctomycetaceae bacterium]
MLRAVELCGFKSFADRTRLEFEEGICAVVGPNGSGKSNIVDAIKWVLGEQSLKKLRSSESTDVIFNGSQDRAPLGSAEVTLSFDNSKKTFNIETPEVHITRRIYRSGEGEYLINRQAVRLKDIKDLLSGTGLGTQAYSIIEQGRVESLLQSTSVQRRVIFEEAAGISRFNAQKQEVQRRLERAEQNLVRLSDIVSEVEYQLKTTRSQAGKAQLYREYTARLQELRIESALTEYRKLAVQQETLNSSVAEVQQTLGTLTAEMKEHEQTAETLNIGIENADKIVRRLESDTAAIRQRITGDEATVELQLTQATELESEIADNARQLNELNTKSSNSEDSVSQAVNELQQAEQTAEEIQSSYKQLQELENELDKQRKNKRNEKESLRKEFETANRERARIDGTVSGLESQLTTQKNTKEEYAARLDVAKTNGQEQEAECSQLQDIADTLQDIVLQKYGQLEEAKQRKSERARQLAQLTYQLSEQKQKQSGMRERISDLEDLIRKHEGLSPGIKEVLRQSKDPESPFRHAFGLVADLLRVEVEYAPLIELALGAKAQHVAVAPKPELFRYIEKNSASFPGRVGFIWLDKKQQEMPWLNEKGFFGRAGVIGRADQFVNADTKFIPLAQRLLGRTWLVENIGVAIKLYGESDAKTNFITVTGELLTPDGELIVGPPNASSGLLTRRAELRTLGGTMQQLDADVAARETDTAAAKKLAAEDEIDIEEETKEHQKAVKEYDAKKLELSAAEERKRQGWERIKHLNEEIGKLDTQISKTAENLQQATVQRQKLNELLTELENRQTENQQELEQAEAQYIKHQQETSERKIELAKSEERRRSLKDRLRQFEEHWKERQRTLHEHRKRGKTLNERRDTILLSVLQLESSLAALYLKKESLAAESAAAYQHCRGLNQKRTKIQTELKKLNKEFNQNQNKANTKQNETDRCRQEQQMLTDRIKDDYGVDLKEYRLDQPIAAADSQVQIDDLRSKLQKLGSVNLEAIDTLEELETRYAALSNQYNDLANAKRNIEKIIEKINIDSKQLFEETFEGVRRHFKELFQHLFGGGSADLILENPENLPDSGVDIIAKPPGKDLKNVMLLSGGEKTMTCVALLLAFFKYRPNPVCILDECDAALDEGNIERFANVIKNFRTNTQFLVITHSKKTMASATTIYGVTMQENGVSKPVSVRFAEVDEDGNLLERKAA